MATVDTLLDFTTISNDSSIGSAPWDPLYLDNVKVSDDTYCNTTGSSVPSYWLKGVHDGSNLISLDSVIEGIKVQVEAYFISNLYTLYARLVKNGTISGTEKSLPSIAQTELDYDYGGSTDMWGITLDANDINANNFGAVWRTSNTYPFNFIDYFRMHVYAFPGRMLMGM